MGARRKPVRGNPQIDIDADRDLAIFSKFDDRTCMNLSHDLLVRVEQVAENVLSNARKHRAIKEKQKAGGRIGAARAKKR